jgi:hypothetical protein
MSSATRLLRQFLLDLALRPPSNIRVAAGVGLAVAAIVMSLGSMLKITFYDKLLGLM